jgi:hypothetical protein
LKEQTMVRPVSLVIALVLVSSASSAFALPQFRPQGTPEERACKSDAHRFCRDAIPDQFRVLSCLQTNRAKITRACRGVLESHGQ